MCLCMCLGLINVTLFETMLLKIHIKIFGACKILFRYEIGKSRFQNLVPHALPSRHFRDESPWPHASACRTLLDCGWSGHVRMCQCSRAALPVEPSVMRACRVCLVQHCSCCRMWLGRPLNEASATEELHLQFYFI